MKQTENCHQTWNVKYIKLGDKEYHRETQPLFIEEYKIVTVNICAIYLHIDKIVANAFTTVKREKNEISHRLY